MIPGPVIGSLFSGYGGLDMGTLAVVGGELAWHCEIEPAASRPGRRGWRCAAPEAGAGAAGHGRAVRAPLAAGSDVRAGARAAAGAVVLIVLVAVDPWFELIAASMCGFAVWYLAVAGLVVRYLARR